MIPRAASVDRIRRETGDTFTLHVAGADGAELPGFAPGQFSMLYAFGVGEAPISISGDPGDTRGLVYTIRSVGLLTAKLVSLKRGQAIGVRGPFGRGWPVEQAVGRDILLVAGGIGLAPLRPVIYHVLAHRADYGQAILLYGARTPNDILYAKEVASWQRRGFQALVTVDQADLDWTGSVGVVTRLLARVRLDPANTVAMSCGPEVMMRAVARELGGAGMGHDHIYLSMERNMKCAVGNCGHCQFGPDFLCKDGPVLPYAHLRRRMSLREI
ncbi:MAG: FAD/NAD(P)-binding protein [Bryobacteraceae bacterium]